MKIIRILFLVILLAALTAISTRRVNLAAASTDTGYDLTWSSLDGGGSISCAKTGYALSGSIAQPDAQTWTGEHYRLQGGFWSVSWLDRLHSIFIPLIRRQNP